MRVALTDDVERADVFTISSNYNVATDRQAVAVDEPLA
jgi:hypothetical protein